jgi:chromosome segregation protein
VSRNFEAVKTEIRDQKQLVLDLVKEEERVRGVRAHLGERLLEISGKKRRTEEELASLAETESVFRRKFEESGGLAEEKKSQIASINRSLEDTGVKLERLATLIARCEEIGSRETIELNRLKEKTEYLKRIRSEHARREHELFSQEGRIKGVLADRVKVDKKYRRCFEACLSPVLQALLTESKEDALRCVEDIRESVSGKVQLLYPNRKAGSPRSVCEGPGIGTARDLVSGGDGVMDYLESYLSDIVITENIEGALTLLERAPERRVATLDGVFFDGPGRIVVAGADDVAMTLLEFDSKLKELAASAGRCEERISRLTKRRDALESRRAALGDRTATLRGELRLAEEENEHLLEKRQEHELELAVVRERISALSAARSEHETEIAGVRAKLEMTPEPSLDSAEEGARSANLSELERSAVELEREKETLGEAAARIRLAVATITGEVTTANEKCRNVEMLDAELRELVVYREEDAKRCTEEIESAKTEIVGAKGKIQGYHGEVEKIEKKIDEAKSSHEDVKERCERLEKELRELKEQREHKRENVQRCTLEIATRETRTKDLIEKARENFNQDIEPYARDRGLFDPTEWEKLDADLLGDLRRRVEAFGPVNMLAVDEFDQRKERFDFLSKQKADLEEAKDSLNQAIRRINKEARRRVSETFDQVRANFKTTFVTLFDGGEADLLFEESDDPLEAKIKLVANPKGKRLQDISSLSGGERALVALSLLFAIYLVKPSPFCVFDEVDAPLDDANVTRFVRLLKSFTNRTQFIVITHNKKTMEAADCLYGVTMEEPGVSRMISVHIGEVDRFRERRAPRDTVAEIPEEVPAQT